jgi:hypothetical protein
MCKGRENQKIEDGPPCGGVDSPGRRQVRSLPLAVAAEDWEDLTIDVVISFRKKEKDRNTVRARTGLIERRRTVELVSDTSCF